jgi:creatinine amidohydrolase/Fe(II)-dependent formamide hydrolase-like protein
MLIATLNRLLKTKIFFYLALFVITIPALAEDIKTDQIVELGELTSSEVRDRIAAGTKTILIPIGGTEQSGPYVVLGKHNFRVKYLADKIADQLGNALVAPVIAYVPEGAINPPTSHMRFVGTISIPDSAFDAMLEGAARSFKQHGFRMIVFLGDHGGYIKNVERVAQKLNQEWKKDPNMRVIALTEYYRLSSAGFDAMLKKKGFTEAQIGVHAGLADTSLMMAVDKNQVRSEAISRNPKPTLSDGVNGDPRQATAELGQKGMQMIVDGSVAAIRADLK